ncbi:uncharacterized protein I303_104054 [Kwoniella dejecticola CBS 10117]|uniref:Ricin B lectin domain-containing protein n=1 Tax=Kwoniella dejecticola CBS 10117 TaxID=1296121 RepID=A0A1A6A8G1_9TREE|nr:uncharacterized protein I303_04073 [Kwoniella dejecticola CBS 10117]OBR86349.1 hypothetical protein I303_04073 [Kwoniella dejecticola CBS 10117]
MFSIAAFLVFASSVALGSSIDRRGEELHKIKLKANGRCLDRVALAPSNNGDLSLALVSCDAAHSWSLTPNQKARVVFRAEDGDRLLVSVSADSQEALLITGDKAADYIGHDWTYGSDGRFLLYEEDAKGGKRCVSFDSSAQAPPLDSEYTGMASDDTLYFKVAKCGSGLVDTDQSVLQQVFELV